MNAIKDFFRGIKIGFGNFGQNIATLVNTLLLSIVYFVGVGITALFSKVVRKRFLDLKLDKKRKSYWKTLNLKKRPIEEYYRQF